MTYKEVETYAEALNGAELGFPFDEETPVIKVHGKMFFLGSFDRDRGSWRVNLKCVPDDARVLRDMFDSITPGYHMNKEHWNSIYMDGTVPDDLILQLVDASYDLVAKSLPKRVREGLR